MSARSLVSAALLVLGISVLPSAGLAEPVKVSTAVTNATPSALQIPETVKVSVLFANAQGFKQAGLGSVSSAMWPQVICVWVGKTICWIQW